MALPLTEPNDGRLELTSETAGRLKPTEGTAKIKPLPLLPPLARMCKQEPEPPKDLTPDELALTNGLEPTTIENLKESQAAYKKMGSDLTLEEVYFLEFDQPE